MKILSLPNRIHVVIPQRFDFDDLSDEVAAYKVAHDLAVSDTSRTVTAGGSCGEIFAQFFGFGIRWEPETPFMHFPSYLRGDFTSY